MKTITGHNGSNSWVTCWIEVNPPARFENVTLESYKTPETKQKNIVSQIKKYLSLWPDVGGISMLGNIGTGKTHLAWAICRELCKKPVTCEFTTVNQIVRDIRSSWGKNSKTTENEIISSFVSKGMLIIDEIGSQYGSESERIIVNEVINSRYDRMKPTIIIGNTSVSETKKILGSRVYDRVIDNGLELIFDWRSFRKSGIKQKKNNSINQRNNKEKEIYGGVITPEEIVFLTKHYRSQIAGNIESHTQQDRERAGKLYLKMREAGFYPDGLEEENSSYKIRWAKAKT